MGPESEKRGRSEKRGGRREEGERTEEEVSPTRLSGGAVTRIRGFFSSFLVCGPFVSRDFFLFSFLFFFSFFPSSSFSLTYCAMDLCGIISKEKRQLGKGCKEIKMKCSDGVPVVVM